MVRSKFPGKPSKIVNRRVVKANKYCVLQDNESSKAAENISYGLAVFNETFGDHEQVSTAFHGFSPHEVDRAREVATEQHEKVDEEYQNSGLNFLPEDAFPVKIDLPTPQVLAYVEANMSVIGPVGWHTTRAQCQRLQSSEEKDFSESASPSKFCSPLQNSIKKHVAGRLLQKAKKDNLEVSSPSALNRKFVLPSRSARSSRVIKPNKRFLDNEESDKDDTIPASTSSRSLPTRVIELKKPRLIFDGKGAASSICSNGACSIGATTPSSEYSREQVKLTDLNVFGAPTIRPKRNASHSSADGSPKKDGSTASPLVSPQVSGVVSPSRSKLILRESKLNVCSAAEKLKEGLFSVKPKKGLSAKVVKSPGTSIECGVCGAVRFYRLTKQALKFGLICCDPCRKFIAKMMVRARSSENSVPCENGQGNCAVSSPFKGESFATKVNRCGACWLLLCVQRLAKMPEKIRDDLIRMLPANMQGMTVVLPPITIVSHVAGSKSKRRKEPMSVSQDVVDQRLSPNASTGVSPPNARKLSAASANKRLTQTPVARIKRKAALVSLANNLRRVRDKAYSAGSPPTPSKKCPSTRDTLEKPRRIKTLNPSKKSEAHLKTTDKGARKGAHKNMEKNKDGQVRQKLSLKGPRVKHVCRSASIVLGQPLATFPIKSSVSPIDSDVPNNIKDESIVLLTASDMPGDPSLKENWDLLEMPHYAGRKTVVTFDLPENEVSTAKLTSTVCAPSEPVVKLIPKTAPDSRVSLVCAPGRKVTKHPNTANQSKVLQRGYRRTLQDLGVYNQTVTLPELISLDFWESYDLDEVCNSGFGLIGFDPFLLKPICFLCGSAGKQKLIHCASCCEPYHEFCVEMGVLGGPSPVQQSIKDKDGWHVDWVCPRCTVCHGCGYNSGHQLTVCQRCHHSYHLECLGTSTLRKSAGDRLWICSSCLRCKSCNSADVSKFVGNLPFCKVCFKLRQKGNFCPLCQGCYTDDDYQSKMMECADCKSWVHAKCEGLSDEKYQVLSYLPESVEFICRLCCACPPAPWWLAVEAELQAGYINIIKAITKNRKAYAMLKWSPLKTCECQHKPMTSALRITNPAIAPGKRRLSFNFKSHEQTECTLATSSMYQSSRIITTFKEDPVSSVFEFDDDIDAGENEPIISYIHAKGKDRNDPVHHEKSQLVLDCGSDISEKPDKSAQFSPNAGSQSDSGVGSTDDELKTCTEEEEHDENKATVEGSQECTCTGLNSNHPLSTLLTIKKKVQSSKYSSIVQFHKDMDQLISEADSQEVKELYHQTLQEVFPWFDPKYDKVSRNSFPLSPCKPYHGSLLQYHSQTTSPEKSNSNLLSSYVLEKLLPKDAKELEDEYFYCGMNFSDTRVCGFCKLIGDGDAAAEGRLLYCGQNEWVHVNCALWSAEVFEEIDGALQNVSNALSRGRMIRCSECGKKGASVGCCAKKCEETLHFPCARMAGFVFMEDKNVFCSLHTKDAPGKPLTKASDFDVSRPVFVELDRRKKKSAESKQVRLMIGSLLVQSLGNIVPEMSDQELFLVPTEFCCTRLFWSSKEPWRIVQYTIRTSVQLPTPEPVLDLGHHVTVDHSKETYGFVSKLNLDSNQELQSCKHAFYRGDESDNDTKDLKLPDPCDNAKIVGAVMSHILDTVCSREADEEGTDVPNPSDLLPPELKDAIFDELPHDLLDGISMQDIFQDKFLSFEELSKDEPEDSCATRSKIESEKYKMVKSLKAPRELKRSKSDVLPGNSSRTDGQLHQRSCSLAWKLSTTEVAMDRTKVIQELRLSVKPASSVDLRYCLAGPGDKGKENQSVSWPRILQVDGVADVMSSCSDEGSDVETVDMVSNPRKKRSSNTFMDFTSNIFRESELLCNRIECLKTVTSAALSQTSVLCKSSQTVSQDFRKCKRRRLGKRVGTIDLIKRLLIPQVDGTNDISSDSDQEEASGTVSLFQEQCDDKPVRCNRCGCTYRTEESYARHLPSCSGDYSLTTSESEAEISEEETASTPKSVSVPSPDSAISVSSSCLLTAAPVSPSALPPVSTSIPVTFKAASIASAAQLGNQTVPLLSNNSTNVVPIQKEQNTVRSNVIATISKVQKNSASKSKTTKTASHQQTLKLTVKGNKTVLQHQQLFQHNAQQQVRQHAIQHALSTSMPQQPQMITMLDYQQSQQSAPTVLVQSVPSQAMVPAYLEAFQQHTGQNLQYLTTVDSSGGYGKTQYLAAVPSAVLPGAFQLQAISDGQLCLEPSSVGIPALSGIQLAQPQLAPAPIAHTQPQVLGTLLQNPLSCGVVAAEPIYETIQMFPDQSGGVLLASQPMLTCMETVVSNTFMSMSSSQFVSSSVPGMLQGSSTYSTTTTQVFQASKVDPPMMDVPTQYVVVNTHPSLTDATVGKLEVMAISRSQLQGQPPLQSRPQIQIPSINLPVSVSVTAPLPLQSLPPVVTTSVAPIPKVQPQRTYSKPSKAVKDSVVRKPVQHLTCSAVKETLKVLTSQPSSKGTRETLCVASNTCPSKIRASVPVLLPEKTVVLQSSDVRILTSISLPLPVPSHSITTSTAPAQSITLPDPVQLNPTTTNSPKIMSGSVSAAKCPPVTFSYRTHAMEKGKPKNNSALVVPSGTSKSKVDVGIEPIDVQTGKQDATCFKTSYVATQFVTSLPTSGSLVADSMYKQVGSRANCSLTSNKPYPDMASPVIQLSDKLDQKQIVSVTVSTCSSPGLSAETPAAVNTSNTSSDTAEVPVFCSSTSVQSVASVPALALHPIGLSSSTVALSQNEVGKNVSLSVTTTSLTNSLTNTATNLTASTNTSMPVATTKLQSTTVAELKPLKEINQASLNSDIKSGSPKIQEKIFTTVSPTILKSASQNVDVPKKNDVLRSQGDMVLSSKDNSSASLKLLFQKQAHNGCYKVSSSPGKIEDELMAVKLADISIVTNGIKDRKGGKEESENVEPVEKGSKKNQIGPSAPEIIYEIHCQDGFSYSSTSLSDAWHKVFSAVQEARANHKMPPLIHNPFNSMESSHNVLGLGNNSLKYLLEQLPGVGDCRKYRPIYHKSRLPGPGYQHKREDLDLMKESHSGCARTEPYLSAKKYDMFSWLDSRHRRPPKLLDNNDIDALTGSRRTASTSLPMAMRYRHLRETSKTSVGVFRSDIHGRGLFCLRDIEAGEMVIEYAGEVIRNTLTDNREKYYQSKGIGCYMFKVDDNFTVDATQKGNAARFINHSCEPNCYSRVVDILGKKHIIIFAFRRIPQGEELTYDYKFPIEDEKIHCHCLARRCRKYLN